MTCEEKKSLVRELLSALDIDRSRRHPGLVGTIPTQRLLSAAFSDIRVEFPLQVCEGDWVATQAVFHQTHTGTFMRRPATYRRIKNEVLFFHRIVEGKIIQQHSQADVNGVLDQLGMLPDERV